KVINNKIDSTQVENKAEEELLKSLLTDSYCHVCEAVLLFKSQRLSHYEGKKHAQKLKAYLQTMSNDKDRFCELCNMVFSSPVVARSHYEGKVHTKNLRKQNLHSSGLDPAVTIATSSAEVDLKDPCKYCALCTASFTTAHVALQHYNGRKHQRNQARQELLKQLGHDVEQNSFMCQMCSVQFNSVEMYQDHMQGNKHQMEKKVVDLCKSQQKLYATFADELADYIQVQKARGITPKTNQVLPQDATQKEDEEVLNREDVTELNKPMPSLPPASISPHQSHPGHYYPAQMGCSSFQGPPLPSHGSNYSYPPPVLRNSGTPPSWPKKRRRHRQSSSSSYTTSLSCSDSYSSYSSSESDSDHSEHRHREKRKIKTSQRDRVSRGKEEERRRKRQKRERDNDSEERRLEQSVESEEEEERRRKKLKIHGKWRRKEKKSRKENFEVERGDRVMDKLKPEDMMKNRKEHEEQPELHIQAEINVKQREGGEDESSKPKYRKEKKKAKEKIDTRTEEEKLWDDSI
uniref:C2H2-type domain-containing protein n=1 Tax=Amphilophus citrinellus TaxID=61819 RepID=A0A3Q0QYP8_AMPCI